VGSAVSLLPVALSLKPKTSKTVPSSTPSILPRSRKVTLPKDIPLIDAVKQWGNVGSLVSALYENDYDLLSNSLEDVVVEPYRSKLIPFFNQVKQISLENGSLGCGISGSGPSIFSLCKGKEVANKVLEKISDFYNSTSIEFHIFITKVNEKGVKIIEK
jgi:homoserine kinase